MAIFIQLPLEVVWQIFRFACDGQCNLKPVPAQQALMHVCAQWREIILGDAHMWKNIKIVYLLDAETVLPTRSIRSWFAFAVQHSYDHPLAITFDITAGYQRMSLPPLRSLLRELVATSPQWKWASISFNFPCMDYLDAPRADKYLAPLKGIHKNILQLEYLFFNVPKIRGAGNLLSDAPALKEVYFCRNQLSHHRIPWEQLKGAMFSTNYMSTLRLCTALQRLIIHVDGPRPAPLGTPVPFVLPRVTELSTTSETCIMHWLTLPSLKTLRIPTSCFFTHPFWLAFVERSRCCIETLVIPGSMGRRGLHAGLHAVQSITPTVRHLVIDQDVPHKRQWSPSLNALADARAVCPNLESLCIVIIQRKRLDIGRLVTQLRDVVAARMNVSNRLKHVLMAVSDPWEQDPAWAIPQHVLLDLAEWNMRAEPAIYLRYNG